MTIINKECGRELPTISIITPCYNQAAFLERTIQSVLGQDYPNLEYIIIDGGSTDGSVDIIRKYADQLAYWVSEEDKGQTHAINKGFRRATGDIVAWLNSDDEYCSGTLKAVAEAFTGDDDVDFVLGDRISIDENGRVLRYDRHTSFSFTGLVVLGMLFSQPACFWKRELFEKHGYLEENQHYCMDYEFFCRIAPHVKVKHIRRYLARFRFHPETKSSTIKGVCLRERNEIRTRYMKAACRGFPVWLVTIAMYIRRVFAYIVQGNCLYVIRGVLKRLLPRKLKPRWL